MNADEKQLDELLRLVAGHIDPDHCLAVDARYRRAFSGEPMDRPTLVIETVPFEGAFRFPSPWDRFRRYTYRETFDSPLAMMQMQVLDRVVPGLLLKDDSPLGIRNNHGTIQVASVLGGRWALREEGYPWVEPFERTEEIAEIAEGGDIDLAGGILPRSFATLDYYNEKLAAYPPCDEFIQATMPDLQGPMDTAEQLWGSDIYYAFLDAPDLFEKLLGRVADAMLALAAEFRKRTHIRPAPDVCCQHNIMVPGRILIRNDSSIMLSPDTYRQHVRPHDARVLKEMGGKGAIHFCGNGAHLVDSFLEIEGVLGLDFGQPQLMDTADLYAKCCERGVTALRLRPSRDEIVSGSVARAYPKRSVLLYRTTDLDDARALAAAYFGRPAKS